MYEIRLLDEDADRSLLEEAWSWMEASPRWFREAWNAWGETKTEFLESAKNEMLFGVFGADGYTAMIRLVPQKRADVFSIHLSAKRKTDFDVLANAGLLLRDHLFEKGVKGFVGWIPRQNRAVVKLYNILGFTNSGISRYKGQFHGRPIEWHLMENTKSLNFESMFRTIAASSFVEN